MESHFYSPCRSLDAPKVFMPTILRSHVVHEDGSSEVMTYTLEDQINPLHGLSYDDFNVTKLIQRGVSLKAIQISPNLRLGFDDEIDRFNSHLSKISSELFTAKKIQDYDSH